MRRQETAGNRLVIGIIAYKGVIEVEGESARRVGVVDMALIASHHAGRLVMVAMTVFE
jgi:hypothetical protein